MQKILFLCTGNSCRSIMAEGLLNHYGKGFYQAFSAGSFPSGKINPQAVATLKANKIAADYENFRSKSLDEFADQRFDLMITVCDAAAGEVCPAFLGGHAKLHWGTPDPSVANAKISYQEAFEILRSRIQNELITTSPSS
jgi:arsenate reductase